MSNRIKHPEAWAFFEENARNMEDDPEEYPAKYRIPEPTMTGHFIYANTVEHLWVQFIQMWYKEDYNSPSVYGKIQYIVNNLGG